MMLAESNASSCIEDSFDVLESNSAGPGPKKKRKTSDLTGWIRRLPNENDYQDSRAEDALATEAWTNWVLCLDCYRSGEPPSFYKLCRRDKSSRERHEARRHSSARADIRPLNSADKTTSAARKELAEKEREKTKNLASGTAALSNEVTASLQHAVDIASNTSNADEPCSAQPGDAVSTCNSELRDSGNSVAGASHISFEIINNKLDRVIKEIHGLKITPQLDALCNSNTETLLASLDLQSAHEVSSSSGKWTQAKTLNDLASISNHMKFLPGEAEGGASVLRCESCFTCATIESKKGLSGVIGSLSLGLLLSHQRCSSIFEGGNQDFYNLKMLVKKHLMLAGDQVHYKALQFHKEKKRFDERANLVTKNLVAIALTVLKTKSAALHFETMVATHDFTGTDVGNFGHGRKQFNAILRAAEVWCDRETETFLMTPLESTTFPPHFFVISDKSTPARVTNQAILICPIVNGERQAIAVKSPDVYRKEEDDDSGVLAGGTASELARDLFDAIIKAYPTVQEIVNGSWMGTSCDGAYQAQEFGATLSLLLEQNEDNVFNQVLWDTPHFLDLGVRDVFDGKQGSSRPFFQLLLERCRILHRLFQRGKMLSHASALQASEGEALRLTSGGSSTRFVSSQHQEFLKILQSFPIYIKAFRKFHHNDEKDYQIAGKDFVLDLCGTCDVLQPIVNLLLELQSLGQPCWKILVYWPRVRDHLTVVLEELSLENVHRRTPLLHKHHGKVDSGFYRGITLVEGWRMISEESVAAGSDTRSVVTHWHVREKSDVVKDLRTFVADLVKSVDKRVNKCTKELQVNLLCMDLETMFTLMCGERGADGRIRLQKGEAELEKYGKDNFKLFYHYVCSLPHVKQRQQEMDAQFDPSFADIVYYRSKQGLKTHLWKNNDNYLASWFQLKTLSGHLHRLSVVDSDLGDFKQTFEIITDEGGSTRAFG